MTAPYVSIATPKNGIFVGLELSSLTTRHSECCAEVGCCRKHHNTPSCEIAVQHIVKGRKDIEPENTIILY